MVCHTWRKKERVRERGKEEGGKRRREERRLLIPTIPAIIFLYGHNVTHTYQYPMHMYIGELLKQY